MYGHFGRGGIPAIALTLGMGLVTACNPVGPTRREVTVSGTVFFDQVPDSGWAVWLQSPAESSGGFCLGLCGGGWTHVGDAVTGSDGTFTITAEVEEDTCGRMWLALGARADKPHTLNVEGRPERQIPCGPAPGHDFQVESGWPWEQS